jgi:RHS repeat-associated protein
LASFVQNRGDPGGLALFVQNSAAKEKMHAPVFSLAACPPSGDANFRILKTSDYRTNPVPKTNTPLAANSRLGFAPADATRASLTSPLSSTTQWGCEYRCTGTASASLVQRYYASTYGRFASPDPYMASGGPADPQSLNRYSYTRGDPINRFDPKGLADFSTTGYCYGCSTDDDTNPEPPGSFGGLFGGGPGGPGVAMFALPVVSGDATSPYLTGHIDLNLAAIARNSAERGLSLFTGTSFSAECGAYVVSTFGVELQELQSLAASAVLVDASQDSAPVGASFFPNAPSLATAQQGRADAATGIPGTTVAQFFANSPFTHAAAQLGGNTIFYSQSWFAQNGTADATYTMFHEMLHIAGIGGDNQLQAMMGITVGAASVNITTQLELVCGHQ